MTGMRVLTVRQPWAWAIIHGGKDVENRVRNIAGDYRGPVAIHAAQTVDIDALTTTNIIGAVAIKRLFAGQGHPSTFKESPRGAIIGVVDIVGAHRALGINPGEVNGCGASGMCSAWAEPATWHLELANPRPLAEPIPFRGALGLRRLPDEVVQQVLAGVAA